jgi:hypothetical protein
MQRRRQHRSFTALDDAGQRYKIIETWHYDSTTDLGSTQTEETHVATSFSCSQGMVNKTGPKAYRIVQPGIDVTEE